MKKVKVGIWLLIIAFLGLLIYQNRVFFVSKESLGIDLAFAGYRTPEIPVVLFFIGFFCFGWLIAYLFSLGDHFKARKQIKKLQQTISVQQQAVDEMKKDVQALKPHIQEPPETPAQVDADRVVAPAAGPDELPEKPGGAD